MVALFSHEVNMKIDKDKILLYIEKHWKLNDKIPAGPTFIMPDGRFFHFQEWQYEKGFPTHPSVNAHLNTIFHIIPPYVDIMSVCGCIRLNNGKYIHADSYISLPNEEITAAQYKSLTL